MHLIVYIHIHMWAQQYEQTISHRWNHGALFINPYFNYVSVLYNYEVGWGKKKKAIKYKLHGIVYIPIARGSKKKTFPLKKSPLFMLHPQLSTTALKW